MNSAITLILSVSASIVSGIVLYIVKRYFSTRDKQDKVIREEKEKESILILRSINAIGKLTTATCIALKDGRTNGEMSAALKEYEEVDKELYNYLLSVNSKKYK